MPDGGKVKIRVYLDDGDAKKQLDGLESKAKENKWEGFTKGDDKLKQLSSTMSKVGAGLTVGLTLPILAAGAATVKSASEMETAFASVRKTVDATEEEYKQLYDDCIAMSTVHPISAAEVATIESLGAQLGITTSNLSKFAEVCYGLDIATNLDAETAATELAQFANICGTSQDELDRVGSTVVALGNTSATTESNIMGMGMRIAASGTQAKMSEANILAVSAALSSLGMEAEAGGTAMSLTINEITKDVATNGENLELWADLAGKSVDDFTAAWEAGGDTTTGVFADVVTGMANASDEGGNLTVMLEEMGITGIRQSDAMKRLASSGDLLSRSVATANTAYKENTALTKEVANFEDTLASKVEIAKNKMEAAAITAGGPLVDALSATIDSLDPVIQIVADAAQGFADMDDEERGTVIAIAGLIVALGPALALGGKAIGIINGVSTALAVSKARAEEEAAATAAGAKAKTKFLTASRLASGALIAIATVALTKVISAIKDYKEKQEETTRATDGLIDATKNADTTLSGTEGTYEVIEEKARKTAKSVDELRKSQAELADTISDRNQEAGVEIAMLNDAGRVIEEYANKTGLTTEEQGKLKTALQLVNDSCGTQYSVVDAVNGVIHDEEGVVIDATTAIWKYIKAKQEQLRQEALQQTYTDLYKQQADNLAGLAQAQADAKKAQDDYNDALAAQDSVNPMAYGEYSEALNTLAIAADKANKQVDEASGLLEGTQRAIENTTTAMGYAQEAASGTGDAWSRLASDNSVGLNAALDISGRSLDDFISTLKDTGASTEALAALTPVQLMTVAQAYDGTTNSVISELEEMGVACGAEGTDAVRSLRESILDGKKDVTDAAKELGECQREADVSGEGGTWASDLVTNIATGLETTKDTILLPAVRNIAATISSRLHQTTADIGPLKDTDKWGGHLVQNITEGMRGEEANLAAESDRIANIISGSAGRRALSAIDWGATAGVYNKAASFGATAAHGAIASVSSDNRSSVVNNYYSFGDIELTDAKAVEAARYLADLYSLSGMYVRG